MTTKEYLSQAYRIDRMVKAKLGQVMTLRELATNATATLSDIPRSATRNTHSMEDIICTMVDLETEINADIKSLLDLKRDIMATIKSVANEDYRTLLELRYLCFKPWGEIAEDMCFGKKYIFRLHDHALKEIAMFSKEDTKSS